MLNRSIFYKTVGFLIVIWTIFLLGESGYYSKDAWAIKESNGLFSIITGCFLHGDFNHIVSNSIALLLTMPLIQYFYKKDFWQITFLGTVIPAILVYKAGFFVIGISGLTFTYIWFLIFAGMGSKDKFRFGCSVGMILFYGSTLRGITPMAGIGISYHMHLFGFIISLLYSIYRYSRKGN